ncbi:MAG: orotidine 5'-phosphate decarboxylase / HUMPS family protein [Candidatus Odinarchaeia archaeon]
MWNSLTKFLDKLYQAGKKNDSRLILALDLSMSAPVKLFSENLREKFVNLAVHIIRKTAPHLAGLKINRQLILPLGLYNDLLTIIDTAKEFNLPLIADCKINDVGHTNRWIAFHYFNVGFDAVIANPFVGWEGALDSVFQLKNTMSKGVILLVYMSHPGSCEGYGQTIVTEEGAAKKQYLIFAEKALKWGADGVICGATFPSIVKEVKSILGKNIPVFSPGIGFQGGKIEEAIKVGVDFPIVGRTIYTSKNPEKKAEELKNMVNNALQQV